MEDNAIAVGQRVRYWRLRRRLGRKHFADMVGRSASWLDKIEKGERNLQRLPMLERVAKALAVAPAVLLDSETAGRARQCPDAVEVQAIKSALGRYPCLISAPTTSGPVSARAVDQQLTYTGHAWLSSHFATVSRALPQLIQDAQRHAAHARDAERLQAQRMLVMAYRLACSTLLKFGSTEVAWLAADRAMTAGQAVDDPIALARASRSVARAMSHTGQLDEAINACTGMAEILRPRLRGDDPDSLPLFGMLLLAAEIAAATQGDASLATELHAEAFAAAERIGANHRGHHTVFGPANVEVHRVSALVRLDQPEHAVRYANNIDTSLLDTLPAERRSNFLLDVADANSRAGHISDAIQALVQAERLAPEEVRCRPLTHGMITSLLSTGSGGSDPTLRQLAHRAGIAA